MNHVCDELLYVSYINSTQSSTLKILSCPFIEQTECAKTYTHPNADLNAQIWKYQYIYFVTHPTVYREIKDTHNNNYPTLYWGSKEPKSAIQKMSLTFSKLYILYLLQQQQQQWCDSFFLFIPYLKNVSFFPLTDCNGSMAQSPENKITHPFSKK